MIAAINLTGAWLRWQRAARTSPSLMMAQQIRPRSRRSRARNGARLVRLDVNRGPGAARNAGLQATSRPFVAFVDSDVSVTAGALERLLGHFADPLVAIAAPRVLPAAPDQPGWVAGYENGHSALDLGATAGNAGPGRRVPYVISAALIARRDAIGLGFAEELKSGEDVDLGWRVAAAGWRVVYDPSAHVRHEHRVRLMSLLRKRWTYGRSIGPLAQRHPGSLAPLRAKPAHRWRPGGSPRWVSGGCIDADVSGGESGCDSRCEAIPGWQ